MPATKQRGSSRSRMTEDWKQARVPAIRQELYAQGINPDSFPRLRFLGAARWEGVTEPEEESWASFLKEM
jgi:hypothetical protein